MQNQDQNRKEESNKITMYTVHSSNVNKIGWYMCPTSKQGVAIVEFHQGTRYMYYPVPNEKFSEVFDAKEKGKWVQTNLVKNKDVRFKKLGQEKLEL